MGQGPGSKRINAKRKAIAKTDAEKYLALAAKSYSVSEIARMCGVAKSTVSTRINAECEAPSANLEAYRATENAKYDASERRALRTQRAYPDDLENFARCEAVLARTRELRIKLNGWAVPVRIDPDLIVSTSAATAAATAAAVTETRAAAPAVMIVLASEVGADEEG